jgi:hypothetical protein
LGAGASATEGDVTTALALRKVDRVKVYVAIGRARERLRTSLVGSLANAFVARGYAGDLAWQTAIAITRARVADRVVALSSSTAATEGSRQ